MFACLLFSDFVERSTPLQTSKTRDPWFQSESFCHRQAIGLSCFLPDIVACSVFMTLIDCDHRTSVADAADELIAVADRIFPYAPELAQFYAAIAKGLCGSCDSIADTHFMEFLLPAGCSIAVDGTFTEGPAQINVVIPGVDE